MKVSMRKLRGFALQKHKGKDRRDIKPLPILDELAQASQVSLRLVDLEATFNARSVTKIRPSIGMHLVKWMNMNEIYDLSYNFYQRSGWDGRNCRTVAENNFEEFTQLENPFINV